MTDQDEDTHPYQLPRWVFLLLLPVEYILIPFGMANLKVLEYILRFLLWYRSLVIRTGWKVCSPFSGVMYIVWPIFKLARRIYKQYPDIVCFFGMIAALNIHAPGAIVSWPKVYRFVRSELLVQKQQLLTHELYLHNLTSYVKPAPRPVILIAMESHEADSTILTMAQVQAALSGKFSYDWIFFSSEEPGDDFKEATSTLAGEATAFYEYLPKDHPIFAAQPYGPLDMSEEGNRAYAPSAALLGLADKGKLLDYSWFWKLTPGVRTFPPCNESRSGMSKVT